MQAVRKIEALYGPFSDEEINHYKKKLTKDQLCETRMIQKENIESRREKKKITEIPVKAS